jgi:IS30 family transposase
VKDRVDFEPEIVKTIKQRRATIRRQRVLRVFKCTRHVDQILALHRAGASCQDIAMWLRIEKKLKVRRETVWRFLQHVKLGGHSDA